uniref:26S proteasome regulatory subunit Rpn7 N-terminal domain-containing protein n=2 Tax=Physcomitrium patens TaxID=3218 RepID=A0A7I4DKN0_PHYPA
MDINVQSFKSSDSKLPVQKLFLLRSPDIEDIEKASLKDEVLSLIKADDMTELYQTCSPKLGWELDLSCVDAMNAKHADELKNLDDKIADAEENLGESERRRRWLWDRRWRRWLVLHTLRLGYFHLDFALISRNIDKAKNLFDEGGDWERKNRLKVYEGLY